MGGNFEYIPNERLQQTTSDGFGEKLSQQIRACGGDAQEGPIEDIGAFRVAAVDGQSVTFDMTHSVAMHLIFEKHAFKVGDMVTFFVQHSS